VRTSGREALHELRATVGLLRDDLEGHSTNPAPHLDQLDELLDGIKGAGVRVTLRREIGAHDLPAVVELAAYRIVQEALTNIIRHADARNAAVSLTRENNAVVVEVTDDGRAKTKGPSAHDDGPRLVGFGLIGMTERAIAIGGRVEHGPMPGGGFRVHAVLPIYEGSQ
jgi:signal transduction histidine kinase